MDKTIFDYLTGWIALHIEWRQMLFDGANAPKRTDGQMLNGIRNRMMFLLAEMKTDGYSLDDLIREAPGYGFDLDEEMKQLPPEMSVRYMKEGEDAIRERAEEALKIYTASMDYRYIVENMQALDKEENAHILSRLESDIGFVAALGRMISKNRLPEMRKYSDVPYYLEQIHRAREFLEMWIDHLCPFT